MSFKEVVQIMGEEVTPTKLGHEWLLVGVTWALDLFCCGILAESRFETQGITSESDTWLLLRITVDLRAIS